MSQSCSPRDYRSKTEFSSKGLRDFGDCCISKGAAAQAKVPDAEPHRQAFRQAEKGLQQGLRNKLMHLGGGGNTNARKVTRIRKLSEDSVAHWAKVVDARFSNESLSDIELREKFCLSLSSIQTKTIIVIQNVMSNWRHLYARCSNNCWMSSVSKAPRMIWWQGFHGRRILWIVDQTFCSGSAAILGDS